jgi:hypothetical protein
MTLRDVQEGSDAFLLCGCRVRRLGEHNVEDVRALILDSHCVWHPGPVMFLPGRIPVDLLASELDAGFASP